MGIFLVMTAANAFNWIVDTLKLFWIFGYFFQIIIVDMRPVISPKNAIIGEFELADLIGLH